MHVTARHWLKFDAKALGGNPLVGKVDALSKRLGQIIWAFLERLTQERARPERGTRASTRQGDHTTGARLGGAAAEFGGWCCHSECEHHVDIALYHEVCEQRHHTTAAAAHVYVLGERHVNAGDGDDDAISLNVLVVKAQEFLAREMRNISACFEQYTRERAKGGGAADGCLRCKLARA